MPPPAGDQLPEVLDDLCMRFVNNLPSSEYESFERLFFAIEAAHWFYEDFYREQNPSLPRLSLKAFAARIFAHSPVLQPYVDAVDSLTSQFKTYKQEVPICGAALLNTDMTKVLLVCGWGKNGKWGFPRGKIANDETELLAAIREVREETGFDFTHLVSKSPGEEPYFMDSYAMGRLCRIYVVTHVSEDIQFKTLTRKEISKIEWVPVNCLPDPQRKSGSTSGPMPVESVQSAQQGQWPSKNFWLVSQFVPKLRSFIRRRKKALKCRVIDPKTLYSENKTASRLQKSGEDIPAFVQGSSTGDKISRRGDESNENASTRQKPKNRGGRAVSRADVAEESSRNNATFGSDSGSSAAMTDRERERFFREYVAEADRRAAELGIGDDFWPVPFLTSRDLGVQADREARVLSPANSIQAKLPRPSEGVSSSLGKAKVQSMSQRSNFRFDRERVLQSFQ